MIWRGFALSMNFLEQLSELGPEELLQHFCVEVGGEPLTEEQLGWFREAAEQADKEAVQ